VERLTPGDALVHRVLNARIRIRKMGHNFKRKETPKSITFTGITARAVPIIGAHTMPNCLNALARRVIGHKNPQTGVLEMLPRPHRRVFNDNLMTELKMDVVKTVKNMIALSGIRLPWSRIEYCEAAPDHNRKKYNTERLRFEKNQCVFTTRDLAVRATIKAEKKFIKPDFVDRLFFPFGPAVNIETGCFIKPIEGFIAKALDKMFTERFGMNYPVVMKGYNAEEEGMIALQKWTSIPDACVVEFDCDHFDKHISAQLMNELEFWVYLNIYSHDPYLARLLAYQIRHDISIFTNDGYRLMTSVKGGRMSGVVNTSIGNMMIMCMIFSRYLLHINIGKCEYVNKGDDCFIVVPKSRRHLLNGIGQFFLRYGLRIRVERTVFFFEEITFCQSRPVRFGNGRVKFVRPPENFMMKDPTILAAIKPNEIAAWLDQVGYGGMVLNSGIPMNFAFYSALRDRGARGKLSIQSMRLYYHSLTGLSTTGMSLEDIEITDEARLSYYIATGITPDVQVEWEKQCEKMRLEYGEILTGAHVNPPITISSILQNVKENSA
jgi:hypothetical protein